MTVTSDDLVTNDVDEPVVSAPTTTTETAPTTTAKATIEIEPEPETWACLACPAVNTQDAFACDTCFTPKGTKPEHDIVTVTTSDNEATTPTTTNQSQQQTQTQPIVAPQIQTRQQRSGINESFDRGKSFLSRSFQTALIKTKQHATTLTTKTKEFSEHHDLPGKAQRTAAYTKQSAKSVKGRFRQFDEKTGFTGVVTGVTTVKAANDYQERVRMKQESGVEEQLER